MDGQRYGRHSKVPLVEVRGSGFFTLRCVTLGVAEGCCLRFARRQFRRMVVISGSGVNSLITLPPQARLRVLFPMVSQ